VSDEIKKQEKSYFTHLEALQVASRAERPHRQHPFNAAVLNNSSWQRLM